MARYEPVNRDNVLEGAKLAFGRQWRRSISKADVIVSLDADFLYEVPGFARYARDFAKRRDPDAGEMSRLTSREHAEFDGSESGSSAGGEGE